jgi:hypothetical protein
LLAVLIEHSGELKRQLVQFAQGPRFEPELRGKLLEVAGDDMTMDEATWIRIVDDFIFGYRFPAGTTVLDKFIQENQDLPAAEREMLQGWSTQVDGIFEFRRKHEDSLSVLNLIDDLEYRVYTNASPQAFGSLREGEFLVGRLVPVRDCWIVSGMLSSYPQSGAQAIAKVALGMIFDDVDGLNFLPAYGTLRELFADPTRAWPRTRNMLSRCARTCARTASCRCLCTGSPPRTPTPSTRCTRKSCSDPVSAGPSTARHCSASTSPVITSANLGPALYVCYDALKTLSTCHSRYSRRGWWAFRSGRAMTWPAFA